MGQAMEWERCKDPWGGDHERPRGMTDEIMWMDGSITTPASAAVIHADTFPANARVYPDSQASETHFLRYAPLW